MQRTLKRELKVLEIVKSEAIEAPKRTRVLPRREFSPRTGSAHGVLVNGGARMMSQGEEVPRLGGGDRGVFTGSSVSPQVDPSFSTSSVYASFDEGFDWWGCPRGCTFPSFWQASIGFLTFKSGQGGSRPTGTFK